MTLDLAKLFESRKPPRPLYPTIRAELDAIHAGKKKMSIFGVTGELMATNDSLYSEILELAFQRRLVVVLYADSPSKEVPHPRVFVGRPEELWRVPALLALDHVGWSKATELQQSLLLGYTAAQCRRWQAMKAQRDTKGFAIYALLTHEQKTRVVAHGHRCFGAPRDLEGTTFFAHRSGRPKPTAWRLVPKGFTLARTGIREAAIHSLFGNLAKSRNIGLHLSCVSREQAAALTNDLVDNVQFMTKRGWQ